MLFRNHSKPSLVIYWFVAALLPWAAALPPALSGSPTPSAKSEDVGLDMRGHRPEILFPRPGTIEGEAEGHMGQQHGPVAGAEAQTDWAFEAGKRDGLFKPFELCC